jgi:hypothetical protein
LKKEKFLIDKKEKISLTDSAISSLPVASESAEVAIEDWTGGCVGENSSGKMAVAVAVAVAVAEIECGGGDDGGGEWGGGDCCSACCCCCST